MAVDDAFSPSPTDLPVGVDERKAFDVEAEVGSHRAQEVDVAAALVAEVEVLPHDDDLGGQAVHQDLPHELLGRLLGSGLVERDDEAPVEAGGGEELELLLEVGEEPGRGLRAHDGRGMPVEGHDRALQAARRRPLPHRGDHGLVAAVHAVVGTDGDHAPGVGPGPGPDVVKHLHPTEVRSGSADASTTEGLAVSPRWRS